MNKHRYDDCTIDCTSDCGHCKGRRFGPFADPDPGDARGGQVVAVWALLAVALVCAAVVAVVAVVAVGVARGWFW